MAFHYTVRWTPPYDPSAHLPAGIVFRDFAPLYYGGTGVELFFVISGFVILLTLERCDSFADFLARRAARLWPPMLVAATLTTIVLNLFGPADWKVAPLDYLVSILFIEPSLVTKIVHYPTHWVDGAYWSLWTEIRFYALAALIFLVARQRFLTAWLVLQTVVFLTASFTPPDRFPAIATLGNYVFFQSYMPYFTFGMCVFRLSAPLRRSSLAKAGTLWAIFIIFYNGYFQFNLNEGHPQGFLIANVLIAALFGLFLFGGRLSRPFAAKPLVAVGQASYSLYLIHQLVGVVLIERLTRTGLSIVLAAPLITGLMIGCALLLFRYVEMPAKLWVHRRTRHSVQLITRHAAWQRYRTAAVPGLSPESS